MFLLVCLALIVGLGLLWYLKELQKIINLKIPSPACNNKILGNSFQETGFASENFLKTNRELCEKYPKLMKAWQFLWLSVLVNDPELIQKALNSDVCLEKPGLIYKLVNLPFGLGVLTTSIWKRDRKFFDSSFNLPMIKSFVPTFITSTKEMLINIKEFEDTGIEFNLFKLAERSTLKTIASTLLALDIEDKRNENCYDCYAKLVHMLNQLFTKRLQNPLLYFDFIFQMTPSYWKLQQLKEKIKNNYTEIVTRKKTSDSNAVIDRIIQNTGRFSENQIQDHISLMMSAGHETVATTISHCIMFLSMYPEFQDKVAEEIFRIFPDQDDSLIDLQLLSKLTYMDCAIKETLRLLPNNPLFARQTIADFEITPGVILPKGTFLSFNTFYLHRRQDIWGEQADIFNPDNFLPENNDKRHPFSFLPFSGGKRVCIGQRFASISMKIILLMLLRNYEFNTSIKHDELVISSDITIKISEEIKVSVKKRNIYRSPRLNNN
ncbi:unnamed protein product [Diamesa tonsa]